MMTDTMGTNKVIAQSATRGMFFARRPSSSGPKRSAGDARNALDANRELSSDELQSTAPIAAESRATSIHVRKRICPPFLCFCVRRKQVATMIGPTSRRSRMFFAQRPRSDTTGRSPGVVCSALVGLFLHLVGYDVNDPREQSEPCQQKCPYFGSALLFFFLLGLPSQADAADEKYDSSDENRKERSRDDDERLKPVRENQRELHLSPNVRDETRAGERTRNTSELLGMLSAGVVREKRTLPARCSLAIC